MPIPSRISDFSATAASNSPAGTDSISTSLDDYLRGIQAATRGDLASKGANIASTATPDVAGVQGLMHDVTGTTTVTGFVTADAGIFKFLKFEGALQLTHSTALPLPGAANITTADGDVGIFISEGSGIWRCLNYMKAAGGSLGPLAMTPQASTSGTTLDFTGIPPWAKKLTVQLSGVSTNGTSNVIVQLGISSGVETSGYVSTGARLTDSSAVSIANTTAGFIIAGGSASNTLHGSLTISLVDPATFSWVAHGTMSSITGTTSSYTVSGSKSLAAVLDRVRVTALNGTDTFDAGKVNVLVE